MWVLLDNYDSFTRILHHYLLLTGQECTIYRNDEITVEELKQLAPSRIIISPGPETPLQAGICMQVIEAFHTTTPILGVCLGHQAIGMFFGATLIHAPIPMHGKTSEIYHQHSSLFKNIPSPFIAMRYHSLALDMSSSSNLEITAHTKDGVVMGLAHTEYPCVGIQFHPESVGTSHGMQIIRNWAGMYAAQ